MIKYKKKDIIEFLQHSNYIEREYGEQAFTDAFKAWEYGVRNIKKGITNKFILEIHRILCEKIHPEIAGKFRTCDVFIGGERKIFVSSKILSDMVKELCKKAKPVMTEKEIKDWHIGYEGLHPFADGNGRSGRLLMNLQRLISGLPILIVHEDYDQYEYYGWFNDTIKNPYKECNYCDIFYR